MELISKNELINNLAGLVGEALDRCTVYENRPKGKWKQGFSHKYECSRCEQGTDIESDYCPWCGADMRGEE